MAEFDYQWKNLPSDDTEFSEDRIREFLSFTKLSPIYDIRQKYCLDVGCGNGRYTYAMQKVGAMRVDSFDLSPEAIKKCREINPDAKVFDLMELEPMTRPVYDFVLCWGVLNHIKNPRDGFSKIASQVSNKGGKLHIMVYNAKNQTKYSQDRKLWESLSLEKKLELCEEKVKTVGGTVHGWFDALNPQFNWGFTLEEVKKWFVEEGFSNIRVITKYTINMNGQKGITSKSDHGSF